MRPLPRLVPLLVAALSALAAYVWGFGGLHVPKIGDEYVYLQIARVTGELPGWLPLTFDGGVWSTKPPLLFWQGIASARLFGEELWAYRLPSLLYTLGTALLAARAARRLGGDRAQAAIAALAYLAFFSTWRYGRPYLTNPPEVFWSFLALSLLPASSPAPSSGASPTMAASTLDAATTTARDGDALRGQLGRWLAIGLCMGVVCLYRSYALLAPFLFVVGVELWRRRSWNLITFLRRDLAKPLVVLVVALACFSLWFLLDPDPAEVWRTFVQGENAGKFDKGSYWSGFFSGSYNVWTLWFGYFFDAGPLLVPVAMLFWTAWRERRTLSEGERLLWLFVLGYVFVFTFPAQRSPSYILAGTPALAVLLALSWERLPLPRLSVGFLSVFFAVAIAFVLRTDAGEVFPDGFPVGLYVALGLGLALVVFGLTSATRARAALLPAVLLVYVTVNGLLAPLEGPAGRFDAQTIAALRGQSLVMPSRFNCRYERYRFLLEDVELSGYDPRDLAKPAELLRAGETVGFYAPASETGAPVVDGVPELEVLGSRLDMRTRHSNDEIRAIVLDGRLDLLVQREWIARRP